MSDQPGPAAPVKVRHPVRANGRRRFEALLDAAERLLQAGGPPPSIQDIAREAGVPMASVYHFLPGPAAVSVALAERYLAGFAELVGQPVPSHLGWRDIILLLNRRGVAYYQAHPYAQRLILGSDHSWAIRSSDIANNRAFAPVISGLIARHFAHVLPDALVEAVVIGIAITDALFALAISERGGLAVADADEAALAVCAYLAVKLGDSGKVE